MASVQTTPRAASVFLYLALVCAPLFAQTQAPLGSSSAAIKLDPERAQKAVKQGDKADAAGRVDEALAAYDEAVRYAPQDATALARGAALRSKLVRAHTDSAENLALAGN